MDEQRIDYPRLVAAANSYFLSKINMVTSKKQLPCMLHHVANVPIVFQWLRTHGNSLRHACNIWQAEQRATNKKRRAKDVKD